MDLTLPAFINDLCHTLSPDRTSLGINAHLRWRHGVPMTMILTAAVDFLRVLGLAREQQLANLANLPSRFPTGSLEICIVPTFPEAGSHLPNLPRFPLSDRQPWKNPSQHQRGIAGTARHRSPGSWSQGTSSRLAPKRIDWTEPRTLDVGEHCEKCRMVLINGCTL